jgi:hypothetical protein
MKSLILKIFVVASNYFMGSSSRKLHQESTLVLFDNVSHMGCPCWIDDICLKILKYHRKKSELFSSNRLVPKRTVLRGESGQLAETSS